VKSPDGSATLMVGRLDWPLPIPMLEDDGSWRFDAAEGKEEILARRIGRNELEAMEVCRAIVDAQREFAEAAPAGGDQPPAFAQKFLSDEGQRNGLYWAAREGEEPSPLGPLVAQAQEEGYLRTEAGAEPQPYHGYYFRMLKAQGPSAPGGAAEYVVNGRMTGGFAVLAYPAEHGNSGIMAFLVSHSGVLYEADLGLDTVGIARSMNVYEPGPQWRACD
jgi:hypothetical protein